MRTGNILANSLHLISKRECIKNLLLCHVTGESLRVTQAFWFLNPQYILRPRLGSECPEGRVRPQLLSVVQVCMQGLAVPK